MDKNTGDYQLVREKNNTYVNQGDMGNYWGIILCFYCSITVFIYDKVSVNYLVFGGDLPHTVKRNSIQYFIDPN